MDIIVVTIVLAVGLAAMIIFNRVRTVRARHRLAAVESKLLEREALLQYAKDTEKKMKEEISGVKREHREMLIRLSRAIRNPMNGVTGMAAMLQSTSLTGEQKEFLHAIEKSGEDVIQSVDDMLETAGLHYAHTENTEHPGENEANRANQFNQLSDAFAKEFPMNILIAEDDKMNQQLSTMILGRLGYQPDVAENGKEVLEMVSEKKYDVILMDIEMPEMDGLEATRMIRLCLTTQPTIIAMTANAMESDRENCLKAGMDEYLTKPVNVEELMYVLRNSYKSSYI